MAAPLHERVLARVAEAAGLYYRLILVVGPSGSGKTPALRDLADANGWPRLNVNLDLSQRLLDLTQKQRAVRVAGLLDDIVRSAKSDVVLLDNVELLFSPELAQDPLRLLQGLARHRTVIAAWSGGFEGQYLTYAEPGHPEARRYSNPDAIIITADERFSAAAAGAAQAPSSTQEMA